MKKRNPSTSAFSLVELTIALGVVVFSLVTILGLLAVGINSTRTSTVQTAATNILTSVAADLQAYPNITPSYTPVTAKGMINAGRSAIVTPLYGIQLPVGGAAATKNYTIYIGENGQTNSTAAGSIYQLNVWITASNTSGTPIHQETFARLLISWPAAVSYLKAQGYVESVVAINRT
jgi:Tfp pilus assembly protein PilV